MLLRSIKVLGFLGVFFILVGVVFILKIDLLSEVKNSSSTQADYAVVLGAAAHGWEPTPVFRERILEGVKLYQEGRVKKIIFTGKPGEPPQSIVAQKVARDRRIPEEDILVETSSNTTYENLFYTRDLVRNHPQASFLIVSDTFHLERAMLMARDLQMKAMPAPVRSSRVQSFSARSRFVLREVLAMGYYLLKRIF